MKPLSRNILFYVIFVAFLCLGLYLRLKNIDTRPMHGDEANQAYQFQTLMEKGTFKYEPRDYHGPTLYYLTLPFAKVSGLSDFSMAEKWHFRGFTLLFMMLTAFASLLFRDVLGRCGILVLTLFLMISPSMVFYSTYYIQESLLLCFTAFFLGAVWRYKSKPSFKWAIFGGVMLGMMHATKETFVLSIFALVVTLILAWRKYGCYNWHRVEKKHLLAFIFAGLITSVTFYSSFFSNPEGPLDSLTTYASHFKRGLGEKDAFPKHMTQGDGHAKAWHYYLHNIIGHYPRKYKSTVKDIWRNNSARPLTEIYFLLVALTGALLLMRLRRNRRRRFHVLALSYTIILTLVYSLIPYKTPWCMLSFMYGVMFCGALAMKEVLGTRQKYLRGAFILLSLIFVIDLYRQALLVNREDFASSTHNPYAYSQAVPDVEDLAQRIEEFSKIDGREFGMPIHFLTPEYWPLPWYLKKFKYIGYYENKRPSTDLAELPLIITTSEQEDLCEQLEKSHQSELRGRLPGYYLIVFYRRDLWNLMIQ